MRLELRLQGREDAAVAAAGAGDEGVGLEGRADGVADGGVRGFGVALREEVGAGARGLGAGAALARDVALEGFVAVMARVRGEGGRWVRVRRGQAAAGGGEVVLGGVEVGVEIRVVVAAAFGARLVRKGGVEVEECLVGAVDLGRC